MEPDPSLMVPHPLTVSFRFVIKNTSLAPEDFNTAEVLLLTPSSVSGTLSVSQISSSPLEFKNVFYSDDVNISITCFATNAIGEDNATTHITVCGTTKLHTISKIAICMRTFNPPNCSTFKGIVPIFCSKISTACPAFLILYSYMHINYIV